MMPEIRPPAVAPATRLVFVDLCGEGPELPGLYRVVDLSRPGMGSARRATPTPLEVLDRSAAREDIRKLVDRAEFLVLGTCAKNVAELSPTGTFDRMVSGDKLTYFIRSDR
jgi:hypothetical protein